MRYATLVAKILVLLMCAWLSDGVSKRNSRDVSFRRARRLEVALRPSVGNSDALDIRGGATDATTFLNTVDLFGTVIFAFSGAMTAGEKGMDLLGMVTLAAVTSVGGGTIRDALLGSTPVFWMRQPIYLEICVATAICTYLLWPMMETKGISDSAKAICVSDALGLGAFAVIGTQKAASMNLHPIIWIVSGLMTATFGGITRDVICQEPPRSMYPQRTMYAIHPLLGSAVYAALTSQLGVKKNTAAMISFVLICTSRILSFNRATRLPHWSQKQIEQSN